jgi:uncharacterized protein
MFLLDINVLIALADPDHVHHTRAESFFLSNHHSGWATCPLTENGFVRIISHPSYLKGPATPDLAREILNELCQHAGHHFWADELSLRNFGPLPSSSKHLTDHYLLSLAVHHQGILVTLDSRIDAALVRGGSSACVVI